MNVSLPDSLKAFVRERVNSADYSNPSDYVRALIRADKAQAELEALLVEGLQSGPPSPLSDADRERFERIIESGKA
ncbi:MAG: type II toxin-antitoxin system ParD family antitoxin [Gammaproteobacteria bacterium]